MNPVADSRSASNRPVVATALGTVGVVHVLLTGVLFGDSVRSVLGGGVFASIDADPSVADLRGIGFWYVTAGLAMILLAGVVGWIELRTGTVPGFLGWALLALAVWGVVLMPVSPFWVFALVAVLAFRSSRRAKPRPLPAVATRAPD